ncbi:MAG: hypothetical protein RLZZ142_1891 [Verrucomicrobiota bacterium]
MVAISVLSILLGMVLQLMGSASRLTNNSRQNTDCDTEARYILDQITTDLALRVRRPDVDAYVEKRNGSDRFYFFAEKSGYAANVMEDQERSPFSLVGYRIFQRDNRFELQRYARALPWVDTADKLNLAMPYVLLAGDPPRPVPETTLKVAFAPVIDNNESQATYYQLLAENVVRLEFAFLTKPDPLATTPSPAALLTQQEEIEEEISLHGFTRIASVVVTLAIVDPQNMARLDATQITSFLETSGFDAQPSNSLPLSLPMANWNKEFTMQSADAKFPRALRNGIRFYQRTIRL